MEVKPSELFEIAKTLEKYKEKYDPNLLKILSKYPLTREKAKNLGITYKNIKRLLSKFSPKEIITTCLQGEEPSTFDFTEKHYGIIFIVDEKSFEKIRETKCLNIYCKGFTSTLILTRNNNLIFDEEDVEDKKMELRYNIEKILNSNKTIEEKLSEISNLLYLTEESTIPFAVISNSSQAFGALEHEDSHLFDYAMNIGPLNIYSMKNYLNFYLEIVKSETIARLSGKHPIYSSDILVIDGNGKLMEDGLIDIKKYWATILNENLNKVKDSIEALTPYTLLSHRTPRVERIREKEMAALELLFKEVKKVIELNKRQIENALKYLPIPIVCNFLRIANFYQIHEILPKVCEWYRKREDFDKDLDEIRRIGYILDISPFSYLWEELLRKNIRTLRELSQRLREKPKDFDEDEKAKIEKILKKYELI
jgi:hypothetical protein